MGGVSSIYAELGIRYYPGGAVGVKRDLTRFDGVPGMFVWFSRINVVAGLLAGLRVPVGMCAAGWWGCARRVGWD